MRFTFVFKNSANADFVVMVIVRTKNRSNGDNNACC